MSSVQRGPGLGASWRTVADPRVLWPQEVADFHPWVIGALDQLAECLGMQRLECVGREVPVGERWTHTDRCGRERVVGGVRPDITARDESGRLVVIEAQFGPADHKHLGQLLTYGSATGADFVVWVVADIDPAFGADHLKTVSYVVRRTLTRYGAGNVELDRAGRTMGDRQAADPGATHTAAGRRNGQHS
ncbi:hypothetical protein ACFY9A_39985 [Streptomyces rubradiris]|uniref:hypothetical protein n=1 Tax=Streptomyces rubradiris TaxID=285531 RepID=UPI0036E043DD